MVASFSITTKKMTKAHLLLFNLFLIVSIFLSGCASKPDGSPITAITVISTEQRSNMLLTHKKWQLLGKIAFIEQATNKNGKEKRESASLAWRVNEQTKTQELNLTSFLGINVLHLESNKNQHILKVDGNEYRTADLPQILYSLTGLTLPTKALNYWLKGLPYETSDQVIIDDKTQLPLSISSNYHNTLWKIDYHNYQVFNGLSMATKFTIKKNGLLIKVAVKKWSFND